MIGIIDANEFYCSCERLFKAALRNKPIAVLSNNDKCIVALDKYCKRIGLKRGDSVKNKRNIIERYNVNLFSSNYTLYQDMSNRVMNMLASYFDRTENYSIDEVFVDVSGLKREYCMDILKKTAKATGIPLSMGISFNKTLAKIASRFAKKYSGYKGVCLIDTDEKRIKALKLTGVQDVWGIGPEYGKMLMEEGIKTAYDFSKAPRNWVRKKMTIVGEKTWQELNGDVCFALEITPPSKKQICVSRSFGEPLSELNLISEAIATYSSLCAEKLRKQKSYAVSMTVFIYRSGSIHAASRTYTFPVPTNSSVELVKFSLSGIKEIYESGCVYYKGGIIISEIISSEARQVHLFDCYDRIKDAKMMKVMDKVNSGYNKRTIRLASEGSDDSLWGLKREFLSRNYTTDIHDIIRVKY